MSTLIKFFLLALLFPFYNLFGQDTTIAFRNKTKIEMRGHKVIYSKHPIKHHEAILIIQEHAQSSNNQELLLLAKKYEHNRKWQKQFIRISVPLFATGGLCYFAAMMAYGFQSDAALPILITGTAIFPIGAGMAITSFANGVAKKRKFNKAIMLYNQSL